MPVTTLHLLCGKIASGKSTLADKLSKAPSTVMLSEDTWLKALFGDTMKTGADYLHYSQVLRTALLPHVTSLLENDVSVVLDFAANTVDQRRWITRIISQTGVDHRLHYLDVSDEICLKRLMARNAEGSHPFALTADQFHSFTAFFVPPAPEEGFTIVRYDA